MVLERRPGCFNYENKGKTPKETYLQVFSLEKNGRETVSADLREEGVQESGTFGALGVPQSTARLAYNHVPLLISFGVGGYVNLYR